MGKCIFIPFNAVYMTYSTIRVTQYPIMYFESEVFWGQNYVHGLLCHSRVNRTPSWYHPFGRIVLNYDDLRYQPVNALDTSYVQLYNRSTRSSKLIHDQNIRRSRSNAKVHGIYTCRLTYDVERAAEVGVYSRSTGFPGVTR